MKNFLKLVFFLSLSVFSFIMIILISVDGYDDPYYLRFTTSKKSSMILGDSRSAQGIRPDILNDILNRNDIYNYSFTNTHSPFGEIYVQSIKKKLDHSTTNGVFILNVTPYSISNKIKTNNSNTNNLRELNSFLKDTPVNKSPNFFYLLKYFSQKYYKILFRNESIFLHDDGWLEITIPLDSVSVFQRTNRKIDRKNDTGSN